MPTVLSLTLGAAPSLGTFMPGVDRGLHGVAGGDGHLDRVGRALTVRDPSTVATGRLVNGTRALASPLQMKVGSAAFAPLSSGAPLSLATFSDPVSNATGDGGHQADDRGDRAAALRRLREDARVHAVEHDP